jgi:hypothetical protein
MNKLLNIPKPQLKFNQLKNFQEKVGSLIPRLIDFSGNSIRHQYYNKQQKKINLLLQKLNNKQFLNNKVLLMSFFLVYNTNNNFILQDIKKFLSLCSNIRAKYKKIFNLKKKLLELKFLNKTSPFILRRLARGFKKDVEKDKIIINPYYNFQLPGFPKIHHRLRRKLKKRLLIQRLRRKYKFIMLQQNLSLHTFMGTKEVSYASLVKNNKLDLIKFLYQYKLRVRTGKRTNFRDKKFIRRPFRVARMNQARFDKMDISDYALWYKKMENQLLKAYGQQTPFEL